MDATGVTSAMPTGASVKTVRPNVLSFMRHSFPVLRECGTGYCAIGADLGRDERSYSQMKVRNPPMPAAYWRRGKRRADLDDVTSRHRAVMVRRVLQSALETFGPK